MTLPHDGAIVRVARDDVATTITIDDGKVNALTLELLSQVNAALDQAEGDGRPVIIMGREGRFSAGFDLPTLTGGGPEGPTLLRTGFELAERLLAFPLPTVIGCTGHAIAMGSFLLCAGDYRLGARGPFKIGANEVAIGMTMPLTAIAICQLRLSPTHLTRAVVTAEIFSPDDAVAAGFLDRVVAPDDVAREARGVAEAMGRLDLGAHARTKLRVRDDALRTIHAAIEEDDVAFRALVG